MASPARTTALGEHEENTIVATNRKNALALALKGLCELQLKNYERALGELQQARALGIPSPEVLSVASYQAASLLNRFERYEAAFEILREYSLQEKDSPGVIEAFGLSVLRLPYLSSEAPPEKREMILMAGRAGFQMAKGRRSAVGRMAFARFGARSSEIHLNRRADGYIGRIFTLERPIIDGRGRLRVDDTTWLVEGPDLPAGTRVQVTSVNNTLLRVSQL